VADQDGPSKSLCPTLPHDFLGDAFEVVDRRLSQSRPMAREIDRKDFVRCRKVLGL
jgi:hypothetical protein